MTLEDDINAVAGRKASAAQLANPVVDAAAANGAEPTSETGTPVPTGLPVPRLPAELLHMRLSAAMEENGDHQPASPQSGASPRLNMKRHMSKKLCDLTGMVPSILCLRSCACVVPRDM